MPTFLEETIGQSHDWRFVYASDVWAARILCVLEGVAGYSVRGFPCDQLDRLHNAGLNLGQVLSN